MILILCIIIFLAIISLIVFRPNVTIVSVGKCTVPNNNCNLTGTRKVTYKKGNTLTDSIEPCKIQCYSSDWNTTVSPCTPVNNPQCANGGIGVITTSKTCVNTGNLGPTGCFVTVNGFPKNYSVGDTVTSTQNCALDCT